LVIVHPAWQEEGLVKFVYFGGAGSQSELVQHLVQLVAGRSLRLSPQFLEPLGHCLDQLEWELGNKLLCAHRSLLDVSKHMLTLYPGTLQKHDLLRLLCHLRHSVFTVHVEDHEGNNSGDMSETVVHHTVHRLKPGKRRLTADQLVLLDLQFGLHHLLLHLPNVLGNLLLKELFLLLHLLLITLQVLESQLPDRLLLLKPIQQPALLHGLLDLRLQLQLALPFKRVQLLLQSLIL
jgi:hypothetical protein